MSHPGIKASQEPVGSREAGNLGSKAHSCWESNCSDLMTMNGVCKTSLDLQDSKRAHNAWKAKLNKLMQSSAPWSRNDRQETRDTGTWETLETLLSHKSGLEAFRDFLKSEFCEENLDFWLACQDFQTCNRPEERTQRAAGIYAEFIRPDSPSQVNLDFNTVEKISQSLRQAGPSCFVAAQRKIYSLMENDSFPRFVQSERYKVLLYAASNPRCLERNRKASRIKSTGDLIRDHSEPILLQSSSLHKDWQYAC